jgi:hypothetical protein
MSPVKEPFFFDQKLDSEGEIVAQNFGGPARRQASRFSNIGEYRELFRNVNGEVAIGEASTLYIYTPGTAERIIRYAPEAKVIALLRNPVDRAYSSFLHAVRVGAEPLTDFAEALQEEERRIDENWRPVFHYRNMGLYYAQLQRYYDLFGRARVGVWLYEDLKDDPENLVRSVFRFLGVDDAFAPDTSSKHNPAGLPNSATARVITRSMDKMASLFLETFTSNSRLYPLASKTRRLIQNRVLTKPPSLDPEIRAELTELCKEDILKLQGLVERDLSAWLRYENDVYANDNQDLASRS